MAMKIICEALETPVTYNCDVLVCGGGTAGAVAALAAAKTGAKTMLVEKENFLGGSLVNHAGPIHSFFNNYCPYPNAERVQVIRGIPQMIIDRLVEEKGSYGHLNVEKGNDHESVATIVDREIYKNVLNQMCVESQVKLLFDTWIAGAVMDGDTIRGVIIENKSGRQAIEAKVVVDCTGDADVSAFAGASYINASDTQSVSMPYALANVDLKRVEAFAKEKNLVFTEIHTENKVNSEDNLVRFGFNACGLPGFDDFKAGAETGDTGLLDTLRKGMGEGDKFNISMFGPWGVNFHENEWGYVNSNMMKAVNGVNTEEITYASVVLRDRCVQLTERLRRCVPGFEKCYISWTPSSLGVRATRIVECEYELTSQDIESGRRFDDEVALYGYHDCAPVISIKDGSYFGFPYRAFVPKKVENLLVAGRIITTEHAAHMSTRNTAACMVQGHAVGTAAALAALNDVTVRALDVNQLRQILLEQDAFLGE